MNAKFYSSHNEMQKNDCKCILKDMAHTFHWSEDEHILDVGSGPGDVTANIIKPFVGKCAHVVGSDISEDMVKFANNRYSSDNLLFKKLDIQNSYIWDSWKKDSFDKIFSFYCLHWIQNIRLAIKNMYNLLKPEGELLIVMLANNPLYNLYKMMSLIPKWSTYMEDVDNLKSPVQTSVNAAQDFKKILESTQFTEVSVIKKECKYVYPSKDAMLKAIEAVTPYMSRIPNHLHTEFLEDLQMCIPKCSNTDIKEDGSWEVGYDLLIAKASKMKKNEIEKLKESI